MGNYDYMYDPEPKTPDNKPFNLKEAKSIARKGWMMIILGILVFSFVLLTIVKSFSLSASDIFNDILMIGIFGTASIVCIIGGKKFLANSGLYVKKSDIKRAIIKISIFIAILLIIIATLIFIR
jgi:hypothetical protein